MEALYRSLLVLLPASLRREFGDDMAHAFRDRLKDTRGLRARWVLLAGSVADVIRVALAERFRSPPSGGQSGRNRPGSCWRPPRRSWRWTFRDLVTEVELGARSLSRTPSFTIAAVLTLAIGIGTATTLFSVVNGVLLRPLPFRDADRLIYVGSPYLSFTNVREWVGTPNVVEAMSPISIGGRVAMTPKGAASVRVMPVGADLFELIDAQPTDGRLLRPADDLPDALPVAVVSERFATENYDGNAVGKTLTVEQLGYEVVGTLPTDFTLRYANVDVWLPWQHAGARGASLIAKVQPGVSLDDARARLSALAEAHATPEMRRDVEGDVVTLYTLRELTLGDSESRIWMLFGAAMLVLLLAAANVATLSMGRAVARREELALRVALGAGRARIARQLIVEASVLTLCGSAAGLLLAWILPSSITLAPGVLPRTQEIRVDVWVLSFALAAGALAVLIFGVAPAVFVSRRSENTSLRAASVRARRGVAESALVVGEVAAAFVLSIGALLLLQTYVALRPSAPGFQVKDRVVAEFELPAQSYGNDGRSHRFAMDVVDGVRALPGSPRAEVATNLPLTGNTMLLPVRGDEDRDATDAHVRAVSPGYLELMEMEILRGRSLLPSDREGSSPVVVVNEAAARQLWGSVAVLGRRATISFGERPVPFEVVGVVRDAWVLGPEARAEVFASFDQIPYSFFSIVIESTPQVPVTLQDVRAVVNSVDRGVPIRDFTTLEDIAIGTVAAPRFLAMLLGALTLIGVLLAGTGCFAVLTQVVGRRARELAVRLTMGASAYSVAGLVLRRALIMAAIGSALGIAISVFATRVLESQIYGIERTDVPTFAVAALAMLGVVAAAALLPAVRVARLDPVEVMKAH